MVITIFENKGLIIFQWKNKKLIEYFHTDQIVALKDNVFTTMLHITNKVNNALGEAVLFEVE